MKFTTVSAALFMLMTLPAAALLAPADAAADPVDKTLCVFDPSGAHGDIFKFAESYQASSLAWGVRWTLKPYTNEVVATQDFKAGQC